jgi:hypothetical protein
VIRGSRPRGSSAFALSPRRPATSGLGETGRASRIQRFKDERFKDERFEDEGFEDEGFEDERFEDERFRISD